MSLFFVLAITSAWCLGFAAVGGIGHIIDHWRYNRAVSRRARGLRRN